MAAKGHVVLEALPVDTDMPWIKPGQFALALVLEKQPFVVEALLVMFPYQHCPQYCKAAIFAPMLSAYAMHWPGVLKGMSAVLLPFPQGAPFAVTHKVAVAGTTVPPRIRPERWL